MKFYSLLLAMFTVILLASPVLAQSGLNKPSVLERVKPNLADGKANNPKYVFIPEEDLRVLLLAAKEYHCFLKSEPTFKLDPIQIYMDDQGRVFFSGNQPHPYTLHMEWCNYTAEAKGKLDVVAAMPEPDWWGLRFRPKAYLGYLPLTALEDGGSFNDGIDAGLMLDFFYIEWANLNAALGVRSVGAGVGINITKNFGGYLGYAFGWGAPHHQLIGSVYFAF